MVQHRTYAVLNIAGLAVGMMSSILILLWIQHEVSYDRFHTNANQIYRLVANVMDFKAAVTPAGMTEDLQAEIPAITATCRLSRPFTVLLEVEDQWFEEDQVLFADSNFLDMFSFPLLQGNAKTALLHPDGVVITTAIARKYFGHQEALGEVLAIDNRGIFTVTGILADIPVNSHLQFTLLLPMVKAAQTERDLIDKS
ncbi:MAG: ABC transporter permease, partial [Bacteroidota bacterium]